jgi:hypothetical protein
MLGFFRNKFVYRLVSPLGRGHPSEFRRSVALTPRREADRDARSHGARWPRRRLFQRRLRRMAVRA